jgi:hypothetical protein
MMAARHQLIGVQASASLRSPWRRQCSTRRALVFALTFTAAWLSLCGIRTADAQLTLNLSNHYTLDNTTGTTAFNSVVGGVNGTIGGAAGNVTIDQPGQVGRAYVFSGTTDPALSARVALAADMLPGTGQFTVSGWIRSSGPGTSNDGAIFSNRIAAGGGDFLIDITSNKLRLLGVGASLSSTSDVNTGDWVHVAVSRNATNLVSMYVNGISDVTGTRAIAFNTTATWYIGNRSSLNTPFQGSLDEIATWTRSLTNQEVAVLGGLGYFAGVGVSDAAQLDAVLSMYAAGTGTAVVGGQIWTYEESLGSTTVGFRGGSVAANDAFIVLGVDGSGIKIVPEPYGVVLAATGIGIGLAVRTRRRRAR